MKLPFFLTWYLEWALPGLGMFSEAYIVFSAGQIGNFQKAMWPACFVTTVDCNKDLVQHVGGYIQIVGIMVGMLLWGFLADITGRKWGSRCVMMIMLSGVILLTFSPYATCDICYFNFFLVAQTWYGFGVGGEYPLASSSAAERSEKNPELRAYRGRQVALVFSNQGMGNLVNASVILVSIAIFGASEAVNMGNNGGLDADASKHILTLVYGIGGLVAAGTLLYRMLFLKESKMFLEETNINKKVVGSTASVFWRRHWRSFVKYWPRQVAASGAWICNDFAFYGNKLQQGVFIKLLYPTASYYKQQQWTVLNSFISLTGYYAGAWLIDKPWYGRRRMQNVGFLAMFTFYIIIYAQWDNMGGFYAPLAGTQAFQALYYLSSFFNQFGPNVTTWLVAGEVFPTDIRTSYHGFAACMGKLGAIIAALWISYINTNANTAAHPTQNHAYWVFLISAIFGIAGFIMTWLWLPDTTGLNLDEYDRLQRYNMLDKWSDYHGEAVNPKHLSPWEIYVLGWGKAYNPELDAIAMQQEIKEYELTQHNKKMELEEEALKVQPQVA